MPLGGYTMAVAARALGTELGRAPLSVTAHFLRPASFGEVEILTTVLRQGSSTSTGRALVFQDGIEIAALLGTFGAYPETDDDPVVADPPDLPPGGGGRSPRWS